MIRGALLALLLAALPAQAATTVAAYLAARDQAIAALAQQRPGETEATWFAREKLAIESLDPMIREIVGPLRLPGFPATGRNNVDSLIGSVDFGKLDGIRVRSNDGRTDTVVTRRELFDAWLSNPELRSQGGGNPLTGDGLYTSAVANNAHASIFAIVPVTPPAGGAAGAVLFQFAQDSTGSRLPDMLGVTVLRAGRAYVFNQKTTIAAIPACTAAFERDLLVARDAFAAVKRGDDASMRRANTLRESADAHFLDCFTRNAAAQPFFQALKRQAQALVASGIDPAS